MNCEVQSRQRFERTVPQVSEGEEQESDLYDSWDRGGVFKVHTHPGPVVSTASLMQY